MLKDPSGNPEREHDGSPRCRNDEAREIFARLLVARLLARSSDLKRRAAMRARSRRYRPSHWAADGVEHASRFLPRRSGNRGQALLSPITQLC